MTVVWAWIIYCLTCSPVSIDAGADMYRTQAACEDKLKVRLAATAKLGERYDAKCLSHALMKGEAGTVE